MYPNTTHQNRRLGGYYFSHLHSVRIRDVRSSLVMGIIPIMFLLILQLAQNSSLFLTTCHNMFHGLITLLQQLESDICFLSNSYNEILDLFSNMIHFISCTKNKDTYRVSKLYFNEIIKLYGLFKTNFIKRCSIIRNQMLMSKPIIEL